MQIHVHHHTVPDRQLMQRLDLLLIHLEVITRTQEKIMASLDEVLAAVRAESGRIDSLSVLIMQLQEQVRGVTAGNLPPEVQAKVDAIFEAAAGNSRKLDEALSANGDTRPEPGVSGITPDGVPIDAPPPASSPPDPLSNSPERTPLPQGTPNG